MARLPNRNLAKMRTIGHYQKGGPLTLWPAELRDEVAATIWRQECELGLSYPLLFRKKAGPRTFSAGPKIVQECKEYKGDLGSPFAFKITLSISSF
jgi:hypothetical protein